jgi:hypothetical protein
MKKAPDEERRKTESAAKMGSRKEEPEKAPAGEKPEG